MNENDINISTEVATQQDHDSSYSSFYHDPTFWVGISFVLVVIFLSKIIYKAAFSMLGNKIDNIKNKFNEAEKLEGDAQKLLEEYKQRVANLEDEVKSILEASKKEIELIKSRNIKQLNDELSKKREENEKFIKNMQKDATNEIRNLIANKVMEIVKEVSTSNLDESNLDALIDTSIKNIQNLK